MNELRLAEALMAAWETPHVSELSTDVFAVRVPTHRMEHDTVSVLVERFDPDGTGERPWRISDDGYLAFLVGEDQFASLVDRLDASPILWAGLEGNELVFQATEDGLPLAILTFARLLGDLLASAHALEAARAAYQARRVADSTARVIAKEMRSQLRRAVPRMDGLYRIDRRLSFGHGLASVRAPFAVNRPRGDSVPPALVASAVDLTASATSIRSGLGTTSLVMDMADRLDIRLRFLLVRGPSDHDDLQALYDSENVVLVPTDEPDALIASVRELSDELLSA